MDKLIFDRTQEDVTYALNNPSNATFLKGAYNYTDLNRIEEWCKYLSDLLTSYNYPVNVTVKTNWNVSDFPTSNELERIRNNVIKIKQAYFSFTQIPQNLEYMTWQKANDIEKILHEINTLIENMISQFYHCGEIYSGEV